MLGYFGVPSHKDVTGQSQHTILSKQCKGPFTFSVQIPHHSNRQCWLNSWSAMAATFTAWTHKQAMLRKRGTLSSINDNTYRKPTKCQENHLAIPLMEHIKKKEYSIWKMTVSSLLTVNRNGTSLLGMGTEEKDFKFRYFSFTGICQNYLVTL